MPDGEDAGPMYDDGLSEAGISEESFERSPEWARERFAKLAEQKHAERKRAEAAEARLAAHQARLSALEEQMAAPRQSQSSAPKTGLDQFETPEALRSIAKKLYQFQQAAVDPDLAPEDRAAAKAELAKIEDVPGTLIEIQDRIARMRAEELLGRDRAERDKQAKAAGKNSDLARRLVVKYGQDALDRDSSLSKKAVELIQDWMADGTVTEDSDNLFVTLQAYKEAAALVNKNRGGRGSDPRHSAVEGNGTAGAVASESVIAALEKRAQEGDRNASRKVQKLKFSTFLQNLQARGDIG